MAKAKATCKCEKCGKEFIITKTRYNRTEADSFEAWAKENCNECPECYAERMKAEREAKANEFIVKYGWEAAIEGVSEKQIEYAKNLRSKYIVDNLEEIERVEKLLASIPEEKKEEIATQKGTTIEVLIKGTFDSRRVGEAYVLRTQKSAREIIDLLK